MLSGVASPRSAPGTTEVCTVTWVVVTWAVTGGALDGGGVVVEGAGELAGAPARDDDFSTRNHVATAARATKAIPATSHGAFELRRTTVAGGGAARVACRVGGAVAGTGLVPPSAARAASASSVTVAKRSAGFFAMPRVTTSSNAAGRPGRTSLGRGGGWCRWAPISAAAVVAANGLLPVRHWCSTQASE